MGLSICVPEATIREPPTIQVLLNTIEESNARFDEKYVYTERLCDNKTTEALRYRKQGDLPRARRALHAIKLYKSSMNTLMAFQMTLSTLKKDVVLSQDVKSALAVMGDYAALRADLDKLEDQIDVESLLDDIHETQERLTAFEDVIATPIFATDGDDDESALDAELNALAESESKRALDRQLTSSMGGRRRKGDPTGLMREVDEDDTPIAALKKSSVGQFVTKLFDPPAVTSKYAPMIELSDASSQSAMAIAQ